MQSHCGFALRATLQSSRISEGDGVDMIIIVRLWHWSLSIHMVMCRAGQPAPPVPLLHTVPVSPGALDGAGVAARPARRAPPPLPPAQRGRSTGTLLTNFTDNINTHLNNKQFIVAIFFDFKKAFDTLEHGTLLRAMGECGVRGPVNDWFRDYLTSRSYRVRVADSLSEPRGVRCGVPQGSAAGPVCYLMLVNSLCRVLRHCSAYMFADDLCAFLAGRDMAEVQRLVQEDVDNVIKWSHDNGIIINADKTKMQAGHTIRSWSRRPGARSLERAYHGTRIKYLFPTFGPSSRMQILEDHEKRSGFPSLPSSFLSYSDKSCAYLNSSEIATRGIGGNIVSFVTAPRGIFTK
ncbi:unnamed protein product [Plutella xylostella]|uniref:(diamondback moth) hypothetical protein n=1 Tax=Plutella xylostella TaxID=51655 RepID=A0A8S4EGX5_PLUXY|nr:unnamed protein product [Plutella xylostella]